MHVQVKFALDPASAPTEPPISRLLLKLPDEWTGFLARIYTSAFVHGLMFYLAGWLFALVWLVRPGAQFGRATLFLAATGWIPFLCLYVFFTGWIVARLRRRIEVQQEAIERLEDEFGDVIGEAVVQAVTEIEVFRGAMRPGTDISRFFSNR